MVKGIEMSAHGLSARPFRWLWGPLGRPQSFNDSSEAWGPENPFRVTAAAAKSLQSCPTLCDPRDSSPPGSPIPGILQARILEWVAISFSNAWKWKVKMKSLSRVWLLATPWTAAYQAPPSMGFSGKNTGVGAITFFIRVTRIIQSECWRVLKRFSSPFLSWWQIWSGPCHLGIDPALSYPADNSGSNSSMRH